MTDHEAFRAALAAHGSLPSLYLLRAMFDAGIDHERARAASPAPEVIEAVEAGANPWMQVWPATPVTSHEPAAVSEALRIVLGQYRLFVGPDDDIAKAVITQAEAALATTSTAPEPAKAEKTRVAPDAAWIDLVEKDDRTSPAEYPDHALITRDELAGYMRLDTPPTAPAAAEVEWHEWTGEGWPELPVPEGTLVDVQYRDGERAFGVPAGENARGFPHDAGPAFWCNENSPSDIVRWSLATPIAPAGEWKPTHRHVKSGRLERVIGEAEAQVSTGMLGMDIGPKYTWSRHYRSLHDGVRLTVYQGEDGKLWVRFTDEFNDGRFEALNEEKG